MAVREFEFRELLALSRRQELIQPCLPHHLRELTFRHGGIEQRPHPLQMPLDIVAHDQLRNFGCQLLRVRHPHLSGQSVRGHTHIATHHILEPDKDFEFLEAFLTVKVLLVVGPYTSYGQVEPASVDNLRYGWYLDAEHHPLVIDGLVLVGKVLYGLVDGFGCPSLDDMAHPYFGLFHRTASEHPLRTLPHGFDELIVRDGHLVVPGEHRGNAIVLEVAECNSLGIGLDERLAGLFFGSFPERGFFQHFERGRGDNQLCCIPCIFTERKGQYVIVRFCPRDSLFHNLRRVGFDIGCTSRESASRLVL